MNLEGNFKVLSKLVDLKAKTKTKLIDDEMKYKMKSREMQYKMKRTRKIDVGFGFFGGKHPKKNTQPLSVEPFSGQLQLQGLPWYDAFNGGSCRQLC